MRIFSTGGGAFFVSVVSAADIVII
jgi:hypothetical protein